jgi:hypothetical protein
VAAWQFGAIEVAMFGNTYRSVSPVASLLHRRTVDDKGKCFGAGLVAEKKRCLLPWQLSFVTDHRQQRLLTARNSYYEKLLGQYEAVKRRRRVPE